MISGSNNVSSNDIIDVTFCDLEVMKHFQVTSRASEHAQNLVSVIPGAFLRHVWGLGGPLSTPNLLPF